MRLFAFSVRPYDELPNFLELRDELGFEFAYTTEYPTLDNLSLAQGYECVSIITNPTNAEMLDKYAELGVRFISTRSIGYDHIDIQHAHSIGIRTANVKYDPEGVADYAIMLMMMACRRSKRVLSDAARGNYNLEGKIGRDFCSCTVGIIGTGRIGATVAKHLQGFGMKIYAYDPYEQESLKSIVEYTDLDTLVRSCDIVTLHIPGSDSNYHMFNDDTFAKMKDGAILVNAARGSLVDSFALIRAVNSGKLSCAAIDTFEHEIGMCYKDLSGTELNRPDFDALIACDDIIFSPHMAFYTKHSVYDMVRNSVLGLRDMSEGKPTLLEV